MASSAAAIRFRSGLLSLTLIVIAIHEISAQQQQLTNTIRLGSSLEASKDQFSSSWKSLSGDFAFGFRSISGKKEDLFLLAIWYDTIPENTLVWYANGENPAPTGSKLELGRDGNLTLVDPRGREIWSPAAQPNGGVIVSHAALLDNGNFVLADRNNSYVWESFRNPTDTILPTQVLDIGGKLTSRKSIGSFSKGRFQLAFSRNGSVNLAAIAFPMGNTYKPPYFESETEGPASGIGSGGYQLVLNETGSLNLVARSITIIDLARNRVLGGRGYYFRATIDVDGVFAVYAHPKNWTISEKQSQTWSPVWSVPNDACSDIHNEDLGGGTCGYNSWCRLDGNRRPICQCLPGFSLLDSSNKFGGCKMDKSLPSCGSKEKAEDLLYVMEQVPNVHWPESANFEQLVQQNEGDCRELCLTDCNCVVAVVKKGSCWMKKLPLSSGRQDFRDNGKAFVKLANSKGLGNDDENGNSVGKKITEKSIFVVGAVLLGTSLFLNFVFMASASGFACYWYDKKKKKKGKCDGVVSQMLETNLRCFTYKELKDATDGFREELGRGAFGIVYKGVLKSTTTSTSTNYFVAIKKLDGRMVEEGEKEFKTEVTAIARTHHKNLARLLGFCDEGANKLLVYEYMSNGTLADFLFGISLPDWNKRVEMAIGIARGIMYLHEECSTQIIHCDIKPHNVLLDEALTVRISDFGLAKLLMGDESRTHTVIRGTRGYVAPEWFRSAAITAKVDVYSYGIMLLEIIWCRKGLEVERENEEEIVLADWAYECYRDKSVDKLVQRDDEARNEEKKFERFVMVGLWCIQEDPKLRPSMKRVIQMLEGVIHVAPPPCPYPTTSMC